MVSIVVLAGGNSDERAVSLRSGSAVTSALRATGYNVTQLDTSVGIDRLLPELSAADIVFPALHGSGGEDGQLQHFLEEHHIAYVGSDSRSSELCFDKARFGEFMRLRNILVPKTALVDFKSFQANQLSARPFVLKPNDGGSSIDTFIVRDPTQKDDGAITNSFERHGLMLLQELIVGTEITVAVINGNSLPVIEIIPPKNSEFDYENKYNGASQELCPPLNVSAELQLQAQKLARKIHEITGCRHMSRTDIIIFDTKLYVLEINTIPGLTDQSLLPKAAEAAGKSMQQLCEQLVRAALTE